MSENFLVENNLKNNKKIWELKTFSISLQL